jgi:glycosyltransferase involved in cell wall biosynthesis
MVFAAEEDFGITMVEAQACGTPVIAYAEGGAADIFAGGECSGTGILFKEQTVEAIIAAVTQFEATAILFSPAACRENAMRFSAELFRTRFKTIVEAAMGERLAPAVSP